MYLYIHIFVQINGQRWENLVQLQLVFVKNIGKTALFGILLASGLCIL